MMNKLFIARDAFGLKYAFQSRAYSENEGAKNKAMDRNVKESIVFCSENGHNNNNITNKNRSDREYGGKLIQTNAT